MASGAAAAAVVSTAGEVSRPSIFDLLAQESLITGLRPALRHVVKVRHPLCSCRFGSRQLGRSLPNRRCPCHSVSEQKYDVSRA